MECGLVCRGSNERKNERTDRGNCENLFPLRMCFNEMKSFKMIQLWGGRVCDWGQCLLDKQVVDLCVVVPSGALRLVPFAYNILKLGRICVRFDI